MQDITSLKNTLSVFEYLLTVLEITEFTFSELSQADRAAGFLSQAINDLKEKVKELELKAVEPIAPSEL